MSKKLLSILLCMLLIISLLLPSAALGENEGGDIVIYTAQDLETLARSCTIDTWSKGKTVLLGKDIDMSGIDFTGIPIFCGTFDGQGYGVKNLSITGTTTRGFFNIVSTGAKVENLNIVGAVSPTGNEEHIGGVAGTNNGRIENCSFSGFVIGETGVGGIAGENGINGEIVDCTVKGAMDGERCVGGIVGTNYGAISSCENLSSVNITNEEKTKSIEDFEMSFSLDLSRFSSGESIDGYTDMGGIAGYSSGMILSCKNLGDVGYPHIGYNVGGIAGRSDGFISACENSGTLNGRKDVGGIAGQMEPYLILNISPGSLAELKPQLDSLGSAIDTAINDAQGASASIHTRLTNISAYLKNALDSTNILTDKIGAYGENAISEIDRSSAVISDVVKQLNDISADIPAMSDKISAGAKLLSQSLDELSEAGRITAQALSKLKLASADMQSASELLSAGSQKISDGLTKLRDAVSISDKQAVADALVRIQEGVAELSGGSEKLSAALGVLAEELNGVILTPEAVQALRDAASGLSEISSGLGKISGGISTLAANVNIDITLAQEGLELLAAGARDIQAASAKLATAMGHLTDAMGDMEQAAGHLSGGLDYMSRAFDQFSAAAADFSAISRNVKELLSYLAGVDPVQFGQMDPEVKVNGENLYAAVSGLTGELGGLNNELYSASGALLEDLRRINAQAGLVSDTIVNMLYNQQTSSASDIYEDTSDEDFAAITGGKVYKCLNFGEINGDINAGGIAGLMSIEYNYDPEDDVAQANSNILSRRYETKAVIQECANEGNICAKKSYAGGIAGQMNLGYILDCRGYGTITAETGDYTGGIAGRAASKIKGCFAKVRLSGRDYVGGVAGSASSITNCYVMTEIVGHNSFVGAVSGNDDGAYTYNYFVPSGFAGLNGVSYAGRAEPLNYESFMKLPGVPDAFKSFELRFIADGKAIKTVPFSYGASFNGTVYPKIPAKEGCYGQWDIKELKDLVFDTDVTAVYEKTVTALACADTREDSRPVWLLQGDFSDLDSFSATLEDGEGGAERWSIVLPDDGALTHTLRYLPQKEKKAEIYINYDGVRKAADTKTIGSYVSFEVEGREVEVYITSKSNTPITVISIVFAVLLVLTAAFFIRRKRKALVKP